MLEQGYSRAHAARSLEINPNMLGRWMKEHESVDAFEEDFDPFAEGVSRIKTKQFSERLESYVSDYANHVVAPHLKNELAKLPTADQHTVEVDGGGEKIFITYPSVVEVTDEYIRSQVLFELGGRNVNDAMTPSARTHL